MSLAGIILALGDMVDSACVLVENAHKEIEAAERTGSKRSRAEMVISSARKLGPSMFGALLVLTIAFLPVFTLQGEEGRLFRPLALAKTFSMAFASVFAVTLVPALMVTLLKGRIRPEASNPLNRLAVAAYRPVLRGVLRFRWIVIALSLALLGVTVIPFSQLGSEFMPPLYEGDLLYMPITVPGISVDEARRLLIWQDARIRELPEILSVFGKAGRAETSLDPAPLSMFETVIRLKPREEWRPGMTVEKLIVELEDRTRVPGIQSAWTMPIKARIDMLSTGIRTPIGIKVFGASLEKIVQLNDQLERSLRDVPGTRSVYAERELGGFFLDVIPDREAIARYGLTVREVLEVVESTIGGMDVDTTIEGRERYKVNVRYPRELRDNPEKLRNVLVQAKAKVGREVKMPPGYFLKWTGQFELLERVRARLAFILPLTIAIVFAILYMNFNGAAQALIVMTGVPFAALGAIWTLWVAEFNTSIAVWVGMIALLGVAAETASVMVVYLDDAWNEGRAAGRIGSVNELIEQCIEGRLRRLAELSPVARASPCARRRAGASMIHVRHERGLP